MKRGLLVWLIVVMAAAPAVAQMAGAVRSSNGQAGAASNGQAPVNLDLRDVDVRAAIEALFKNTGKNYSIDANVSGTVPAVSFKDVAFDTALRNLTKTAGIVYRVDASSGSEIYLVKKREEVVSQRLRQDKAIATNGYDKTHWGNSQAESSNYTLQSPEYPLASPFECTPAAEPPVRLSSLHTTPPCSTQPS